MTAIAVINKEAILAQIREGKVLREIAPQFGISKVAISQALSDDPDYQAALKEQAKSMIYEAKVETWEARDPINIARAREMAKFAFRYAEGIDPERWGRNSQITVNHRSDLGDRLRRARNREQVIEGERVADTPKLQRTSDDNVQDV